MKSVNIGTKVKIIEMTGEPHYKDKEGVVTHIDDIGQLHGTWGGCAIIPEKDTFEIIKGENNMKTVFTEEVDKMLLAMEDEDLEEKIYKYKEGFTIDDLVPDKSRVLEKALIAKIEELGLNLNQPVICHEKDWDENQDPFDMVAIYMCPDFYIATGFYSIGDSMANAMIGKFKDKEYFDLETADFKEMEELFSEKNEEPIKPY
jgi:Domain of unknown function (DUF4314)